MTSDQAKEFQVKLQRSVDAFQRVLVIPKSDPRALVAAIEVYMDAYEEFTQIRAEVESS